MNAVLKTSAVLVILAHTMAQACIDPLNVYYSGIFFNDGESIDLARLQSLGTEGVNYFTECTPSKAAQSSAASSNQVRICGIKYRGHLDNTVMIQIGNFPLAYQPSMVYPRLIAILDSAHIPTAAEKAAAIAEELQWLTTHSILNLAQADIAAIVDSLSAQSGQYWTLQDKVLSYNSWYVYNDSLSSWRGSSGVYGVNGVKGGCGADVAYELPPRALNGTPVIQPTHRPSQLVKPTGLFNGEMYNLRGVRTNRATIGTGIAIARSGAQQALCTMILTR
jgi:hypothetical protein